MLAQKTATATWGFAYVSSQCPGRSHILLPATNPPLSEGGEESWLLTADAPESLEQASTRWRPLHLTCEPSTVLPLCMTSVSRVRILAGRPYEWLIATISSEIIREVLKVF